MCVSGLKYPFTNFCRFAIMVLYMCVSGLKLVLEFVTHHLDYVLYMCVSGLKSNFGKIPKQ